LLTLVLRFNQEVVAYSVSLFDVHRCVQGEKLALRHYAYAIGKLISLFDMLGTHDYRAAWLNELNQVPHLTT
jgi:hypothetical protein